MEQRSVAAEDRFFVEHVDCRHPGASGAPGGFERPLAQPAGAAGVDDQCSRFHPRKVGKRDDSAGRIVQLPDWYQDLGVLDPVRQQVDIAGVIVPDGHIMAVELAEGSKRSGPRPGSRPEW